jgi:hypothetical protein
VAANFVAYQVTFKDGGSECVALWSCERLRRRLEGKGKVGHRELIKRIK